MSLADLNPLYAACVEEWTDMRNLYKGERAIKAAGQAYLKPTAGMLLDGMASKEDIGYKNYEAYKMRAVLHDYVKDAVEFYIGLLHQEEANIELPASMEFLRDKATLAGESLQMVLRRINEEQLVTGRIGVLADLPVTPSNEVKAYLALYIAESIINWDDGSFRDGFNALNLVVLNESGFVRDENFNWTAQEKYRVLQLGELAINEAVGAGVYSQGVFESQSYNAADMKPPAIKGQSIDQIPFVFINSKDIVSSPDRPPLIGLGDLVLAIYRGEADYRQTLYMQGQDTLVTMGGVRNPDSGEGEDEDAIRTGAGSRIDLELGGDAKYIGVSSEGLPEQRTALENDKKRAEIKSGAFVNNNTGGNKESGESIKIRIGATAATLNQIAKAGAGGLQEILRIIAVWIGANPEDVKVTPNLEFADAEANGQDYVYFMTARGMGLPLSLESIHAILVSRGLTKLTFEQEQAKIEEENAQNGGGLGTTAGGTKPLAQPVVTKPAPQPAAK